MSAALRVGDFDLHLAVYTCERTFYAPTGWQTDNGRHRATGLVNGDGPEARPAPNAELRVEVLPAADKLIRLRVHTRHEAALKAIKIALDLPCMKMLAPEDVELEDATWRDWHFPRDWRTGFAVWAAGQRYFTVVTHEAPWRFKRLRALRTGDSMRLEIIQDANLRDRTRSFTSSVWEIGYRDAIGPMLADYARFVQQGHGALAFDRRQDMPDWVRRLGLVVNLHNTDWNGYCHLDFAAMSRACTALAERFPPEQTLLYPIGWDGRYMRDYPDYRPSTALGGHDGFKRFCEQARGQGFHIMPHLNAMAINMRHPLYLQHLKDYVLRDHNGVPQHSFKIDWDHDGLGDPAHAYIALQPPALREILVDAIERLVRDYGIDAVFLDETCNVFYNDPAWDQVEGVRLLVRDLHQALPGLLIAGEEWNEMLLGLTPVVQIWEETADGRVGFGRGRSPLLRAWAAQFVRACGYLALASPDGQTGVHEWPDKPWIDERDNEAFYLPTLSITGRTLERGLAGIDATVTRARDYVSRFVSP
ncbi:MAG: DUF6259 domain-containing protein [Phycisphaerae bacterium]|jgi:hypothetical protein